MNNAASMVGKTFKTHWVILGCPRTAYFRPASVAKNGKLRGAYTDADGKTSYRFFMSTTELSTWIEC